MRKKIAEESRTYAQNAEESLYTKRVATYVWIVAILNVNRREYGTQK